MNRGFIIILLVFLCGCITENCKVDSDCVAFGEDGDCNCQCYYKDDVPSERIGKCFCVALKNL